MSLPPSVFLVGPMGAGKSTVGKRLSEILGWRFVDSDREIEARTGVDIPYIFEREGEAGFREREAQMIDELTRLPGIVLATGGGAVMRPANRAHLAERGLTVYLRASVEQQVQRTARGDNRPLLRQGNPAETLQRLFTVRDPLYREVAGLTICTDGRTARTISRDIAVHLRSLALDPA